MWWRLVGYWCPTHRTRWPSPQPWCAGDRRCSQSQDQLKSKQIKVTKMSNHQNVRVHTIGIIFRANVGVAGTQNVTYMYLHANTKQWNLGWQMGVMGVEQKTQFYHGCGHNCRFHCIFFIYFWGILSNSDKISLWLSFCGEKYIVPSVWSVLSVAVASPCWKPHICTPPRLTVCLMDSDH